MANRSLIVALLLILLQGLTPLGGSSARANQTPDLDVDPTLSTLDVGRDGDISHVDVVEVQFEWEKRLESGRQCDNSPGHVSPADVNRDGCVTVADVQMVTSHLGSRVRTVSPGPDSPSPRSMSIAASPFVVTAASDDPDAVPGDGICATSIGTCTLRSAITEANLLPGPDTITFSINGTGRQEIQLSSPLPTLSDETGGTTIDGYSQAGAQVNTDPVAFNATIMVQLVGMTSDTFQPVFEGLKISSAGNIVRGIAFARFTRSVWLHGPSASDNHIAGNIVGLFADGSVWADRPTKSAHGVALRSGAHHNQIGDVSLADRNVISGNAAVGIWMLNADTAYNHLFNNIIGLTPDGGSSAKNWQDGIDLNLGAAHNRIGGTLDGERNVISGNAKDAIELSHDPATAYNVVAGNYIGTDLTGTGGSVTAHRNPGYGVTIEDGPSNNIIGPGNVISNNGAAGVRMYGPNNVGNHVFENRIGVNLNGEPLPNRSHGVILRYHASNEIIGPGNIIAYNYGDGIWIKDSNNQFNTITQNSIYDNRQQGIDIAPAGLNLNDDALHNGGNGRLYFPILRSATRKMVIGSACSGCTVEVFKVATRSYPYGEGQTFLGSVIADGTGAFALSISGVTWGDEVTATATDATGNTSEFSLNRKVTGSTAVRIPARIEAEDYRSGGDGIGYLDATPGNIGGAYLQEDVDILRCDDETTPALRLCHAVGWIARGEWLEYEVKSKVAGYVTVTLRTATPDDNRRLHLEIAGQDVTGPVMVPNSGGFQNWVDVTTRPFEIAAGVSLIRVVADTPDFNINYLIFERSTVPADNPPLATLANPGGIVVPTVVPIQVAASDDLDIPGTLSVEVAISGGQWNSAWYSPASRRYEWLWDARGLEGESHTVDARITDSSGNVVQLPAMSVAVATTPEAVVIPVPSLIEAEDYRSGGPGVGYEDSTPGNSGRKYRDDDVDIQSCSDFGTSTTCWNIGYIRTAEWLGYTIEVAQAGNYSVSMRVATTSDGRSLHLEIDGVRHPEPILIPNTGGLQTWADTPPQSVYLDAGLHTLRIVANTPSFNLNHFTLALEPS